MDMDWHKEFIKMPHRMAKDCYMSPQDTIAVQRSIRIFLMREKILQTSGCSAVQYVLAHSCTRFPCYLGMEINAGTQ